MDIFQMGLQKKLLERIYNKDTLPTTMDEWYRAVKTLDNQWRRMRRIMGVGGTTPVFERTSNTTTPVRDPNAMDIDQVAIKRLSAAERECCFKEGLCFRCRKKGHRSANCPGPQQTNPKTSNQGEKRTWSQGTNRNIRQMTSEAHIEEVGSNMPTKERVAKIRALLNEVPEEEKETVLDELANQGFA